MHARRVSMVLSGLLLALTLAPSAFGQDDKFDEKITEELRSRNPEAVDLFTKANLARKLENYQEASDLFRQVRTMAPGFSHAWRREGYALLALGRWDDALDRMKRAMDLERTPWNMEGLATVLAVGPGDRGPTQANLQDAAALVHEAEADTEDTGLALLGGQLALRLGDDTWLATEASRIERLDPKNPWGAFFEAVHLANTGKRNEALGKLERARELGLPDPFYGNAKAQLEKQPSRNPVLYSGGIIAAVWIGGMLLLVAVGSLLSQATLSVSRRVPRTRSGGATGWDALLRKTYRYVLGLCCLYYFVSLPIIVGIVLLVGGGLVYLMLLTGHIPIKLLAIVVVLTVVTVWAIVRSLVIRTRDEDPGLKLDLDRHPRLRGVLDEVARTVGTRPVSNVYLTPGTEFAVMERGGMYKQLRGHSERCLILGVGTLEGMRLRPFRAVLAHEYGHFSNQDTAGGGFALAVRRSLMTTALNLGHSGAAAWYNPAWLFVIGFHRVFLRVSQGASRLQEVLADRWAAFSYGSRAFAEGLRHVIERSVRFNAHVNSVLKEVIETKKPLANLYAFHPTVPLVSESDLSQSVQQAMDQEPSPYDSHPRPVDRMAWVEALGATGGPTQADDLEEVWSLFTDRNDLERRLTDEVRGNIGAMHGIVIPGEGAKDDATVATV